MCQLGFPIKQGLHLMTHPFSHNSIAAEAQMVSAVAGGGRRNCVDLLSAGHPAWHVLYMMSLSEPY